MRCRPIDVSMKLLTAEVGGETKSCGVSKIAFSFTNRMTFINARKGNYEILNFSMIGAPPINENVNYKKIEK